MFVYIQFTFILIIKGNVDGFKVCHDGPATLTVYADVNESAETTFCAWTVSKTIEKYFLINSRTFHMNDTSAVFGVILINQFRDDFFLKFYIRKVTDKDYGSYKLNFINRNSQVLNIDIELKSKVLLMRVLPEKLRIGEQHNLTCGIHSSQTKDAKIFKTFKPTPLVESVNMDVTFIFYPLLCQDMGSYSCISENPVRRETKMDLRLSGCPPVLCENQVFNQTYQVHIGSTVAINYCIISSELNTNININNQIYELNQAPNRNIQVISNISQSQLYHNITVYVYHILPGDDQLYTVLFNTTTNRKLKQKFYIFIQPDKLRLCDTELIQTFLVVDVGKDVLISTCINVELNNNLHQLYVELNGTIFYQNGCVQRRCVLWSNETIHGSIHHINITINNIVESDFGILNITVRTKYNNTIKLSEMYYTRYIIRKVSCPHIRCQAEKEIQTFWTLPWSTRLCPRIRLLVTSGNLAIQNETNTHFRENDFINTAASFCNKEYNIQLYCVNVSITEIPMTSSCIYGRSEAGPISGLQETSTKKAVFHEFHLFVIFSSILVLLSCIIICILLKKRTCKKRSDFGGEDMFQLKQRMSRQEFQDRHYQNIANY